MVFKLLNRNKEPLPNPTIESIKQAQDGLPGLPELPKVTQVYRPMIKPKPIQTKEVWKIVLQLPMQPIRQYTEEDGTVVHLVTVEEYLTEQANVGNE